MKDFEAFLEGRGRMAGLLQALPPFEPPAGMETRFLASLPAEPGPDGSFEPPPSLAAAVFAEAARLDAAQRPRQQATLDEVARHGAREALGVEPGEATRAWLDARRGDAAAAPAAARRPRRRWLAPLGSALAATVALGVALQLMREGPPEQQPGRSQAPRAPAAATIQAQPPAERKAELAEEAPPPPPAAGEASADLVAAPPQPAAKPAMPLSDRAELRRQAAARPIAPAEPLPAPAPAAEPASLAKSLATAPAGTLGRTARRRELPASALAGAAAPLTAQEAQHEEEEGRARAMPDRFALQDIDGLSAAIEASPQPLARWRIEVAESDLAAARNLAEAVRKRLADRGRVVSIEPVTSGKEAGWLILRPLGE